MKSFLERLEDPRPILYDGGFGSQLFARGVELTNSTLANESHPDDVAAVHLSYIEAGAEVIGTNTFVASPLHLEMAGKEGAEADRIVRLAVRHAKEAVEKGGREVYVAGSIGPSPGAIEADAGDTDFGIANEKVRDAHTRVIEALAAEGVDFFCIETMFSAREAAMIVDIVRKTGLPAAVNLTYKYTKNRRTGGVLYRTDWGDTPESVLDVLSGGEYSGGDDLLPYVHVLGLNCGAESLRPEHTGMPYAITGIQQTREALEAKGVAQKRLMAYPNAGIPKLDRQTHQTTYSQVPEEMAAYIGDLLKEGAHLVGGCCGTTPDHIRAFRQAIDSQ